ncbi:MAG: hypothetical protein FJ271_17585 [Planctomycetes bacterium]|nr:hypothetical protein [Planctomycetota bacterium]
MPRRVDSKDEWDDEDSGEWEDALDDAWQGAPDDDSTILCPHCGREFYQDSPRCPHCERYISREEVRAADQQPQRKPWWIIIGTLACLYVIYRWIAH